MKTLRIITCTALALAPLTGFADREARGVMLVKNICRVKGQEQNELHGLGLVVGLKGTGDSGDYLPTMRALARSMELMGSPIGKPDLKGRGGLEELADTKNVALVWVTAIVPASGARRGDMIDCDVSAISAKSLEGGRLAFAAMRGPNVSDPRVKIYGISQGRIHLDDPEYPTQGRIHQGCRLEEDFFNVFIKNGKITLVLDQGHSNWEWAAEVARLVNQYMAGHQVGRPNSRRSSTDKFVTATPLPHALTAGPNAYPNEPRQNEIAKAISQSNIEVAVPEAYRDDAVQFVAEVISLPISYEPRGDALVVVNQRTGTIVIGADVEIGSVVVTHKNIVVEAGADTTASQFVPLDTRQPELPKLMSLAKTLDALKVPPKDVIEIIKVIESSGKLHGQLIVY